MDHDEQTDTTEVPTPAEARPGPLSTHPLDLTALVWGLILAGVGVLALASAMDWVRVEGRSWTAATLIAVGSIGVVAVVATTVRRRPD